jgi:hypothetical protein
MIHCSRQSPEGLLTKQPAPLDSSMEGTSFLPRFFAEVFNQTTKKGRRVKNTAAFLKFLY